jgi:hypothetical protein
MHVARLYKKGAAGQASPLIRPARPDVYRRRRVDGVLVKTHRYVMEEMLGRQLLPNENVHHRNGDIHDNRPENLELWTTSQPPGQRVDDKIVNAVYLLNLYAPEMLMPQHRGPSKPE